MIEKLNLLRSINQLTIFKLGNHSNQEVDRLRRNIRYNSISYLWKIQFYGDAQDIADLVNVQYGKVICISFSSAGGIGEENDEQIRNGLYHINNFIREQHVGRYFRQPSFQPLPLLARMTEEQMEEEGALEEMEAQMNNNGYYGTIKDTANNAKVETLNHFIQW
ncbi:MAG: hypothetical protein EZS28_038201 [Streblomastix strix]|uniref:Uncharacterized protein n=1 Tax=Streblomastix strix TaxID=222440 RepID=A0A5J4U7T2_9EUKA|nr:MAG: hypothetical protein EZS28_038201 [Streblomastix strix]